MKKITLFFCIFVTFLCLAQNASAQYVGDETYKETYLSANKQCKAGRTLIWSGAAGTVAGLGMMLYGQYLYTDSPYMNGIGTEKEGKVGLALCAGGLLVSCLSSAALDVGIPLSIIGKKRLEWVSDNYDGGVNLTYQVGAAPNGFGLTLHF